MLTCPGPAQLGGKAGALEAGLPGPTRGPTPLSPFLFFLKDGSLQNKTSRNLDLSGRERNTSPLSLHYPRTATNHTKPPQSRSSDEALGALPIPLISDAPSCRSACLGLRGPRRQAFFRVLDR